MQSAIPLEPVSMIQINSQLVEEADKFNRLLQIAASLRLDVDLHIGENGIQILSVNNQIDS